MPDRVSQPSAQENVCVKGVLTKLVDTEAEALYRAGAEAACGVARAGVVGFDQHAVHLDVARGHFKTGRKAVQELLDDALAVHTDDAAMRTGHAYIGDEGGAAGEDVLVGSGHVGVRADDNGHAAVQIPAHSELFAGGLRVHVHQDEGDVLGNLGELAIGLAKWIVDGSEKDTSLEVQDSVLDAIFCGAEEEAAAWGAVGK